MGAGLRQQIDYWNIVDGRLWRNDPSSTITRSFTDSGGTTYTKNGHWADYYEGKIVDLLVQQTDFGQFLRIKMQDGKEVATISTQFNGSYAMDLMKRLLNSHFQIEKPVKLSPFAIEKEGKTKKYLLVYQDGLKIDSPFNEQNPLPEWKQVKVRGEVVWDNSEQLEYLWSNVQERFIEYFAKVAHPAVEPSASVEEKVIDDEFPF